MLLIVVTINDPSFSPILSVKGVVISLLTSIQSIVSVSGRISPQFWEVFHKPTTNLCFSLLIFQQLRSILLCKDAFQVHLWQKISFSSPSLYPNNLASILSPGDIVMLLFSLIFSNWGSCSFLLASPFNRSVVSSLQVLSSYQVLPLFSTWVLSEILLTHYAILSIVPEAVCCWFHQVSSHLVKFMFYSFHVQPECCPNSSSLILF